MNCPACAAALLPQSAFCGECGASVPPCASCGQPLVAGTSYCGGCGHPVTGQGYEAPTAVMTAPSHLELPPHYQAVVRGAFGLHTPAGFGQRLGARIIDALICTVPVVVLYVALLGAITGFGSPSGALLGLLLGPLLVMLGSSVAQLVYLQRCETAWGRTVGRAATGIRVISLRPEAGPEARLRGGQALWRRIVQNLGECVFGLAAFSMLWDPQRRTWGDKASQTAVIQDRTARAGQFRGLKAAGVVTSVTAVALVGLVGLAGRGSSDTPSSFAYSGCCTDTTQTDSLAGTDSGATADPTADTTTDLSTSVDPSASTQVAAFASVPTQADNGVDASGATTSYGPENLLDGTGTTTWRMQGDGSGSDLFIRFDATRTITSVGLINGYAKIDPNDGSDRYLQERQVTAVTWTFSDGQSFTQPLDSSDRSMQALDLPTPASADSVTLHIDATTQPGDPDFDYTAISEVAVYGQ